MLRYWQVFTAMIKYSSKIGLFALCALALLNVATVRKNENYVVKTQTDPIAYKDKLEEIKDGEKEAPSPSYKYYPKAKFLVEPPVEAGTKETDVQPENKIPEIGAKIPEDLSRPEEENILPTEEVKEEEKPKEEEPKEVKEEEKTENWWSDEEVPKDPKS